MIRQKIAAGVLLSALTMPTFTFAQQGAGQSAVVPPPPMKVQPAPAMQTDAISKIKAEGMERSQAMATMRYLTDVIGPRLTNSPAQRRANQWTKEQLEKWGMQNAKVDPWGEFGRGWELKRYSAEVLAPEYMVLRSFPKAWSPSTPGAVTGDVIYVDATDEAGLEKYKGKLKGAIVLVAAERGIRIGFDPTAQRRDAKNLTELENAKAGQPQTPAYQITEEQRKVAEFNARKFRFYHEEGAAVLIEPSQQVDAGTIRVVGANVPTPAATPGQPFNPFGGVRVYSKEAPKIVPQVVAEAEQYNRLVRLAKQGTAMKMRVDLNVQFYDDDLQGYNTIAEIPGTDLKDEVVMIGAHLDSWHAGTGATDNGAGVTVVMEAMRILQAAGIKPRRTIRVALWTGEEQGLLGSRGYVAKNFASTAENADTAAARMMLGGNNGKITLFKKPAYDKFAAYYNLDNGTGAIRGVYMQGNEALRPIFREWLAPFGEMGASTLTVNSTGGTDHLAFDAVGLPGFQFIQDPIEYSTRTWHTTQDVSDRTIEEDLKKSAIIMAAFAYNSAVSDQKLPRKENTNLDLRAMFKVGDNEAAMDELAFRVSNLQFAICGHNMKADELPQTFPSAYALKPSMIVAE
jgi:carboxypeptidase Q